MTQVPGLEKILNQKVEIFDKKQDENTKP